MKPATHPNEDANMPLQPPPAPWARIAAIAFALALSVPGIAFSAHAAGNDAQDARDQAAVAAVKLDMDSASRVAAVGRDAQGALRKSCLFHGDGTDKSLDACTTEVSTQPQIAAALAKHGLSARQFTLVMSALMQGDLGAQSGAEASGMLAGMGINPAHVQFVKAHRAELDKLFGSLRLN